MTMQRILEYLKKEFNEVIWILSERMIVELEDFSRSSFVDFEIVSDRVVVSGRTSDGEVNDYDCVIVNQRNYK